MKTEQTQEKQAPEGLAAATGSVAGRDQCWWVGWLLLYPFRLSKTFVFLGIIACAAILMCAVPSGYKVLMDELE